MILYGTLGTTPDNNDIFDASGNQFFDNILDNRLIDERNHLFDFLRDNEITGVFGLSGDTHVVEFNAIPWSEEGGYDFYDLDSSPLAQRASDNWKKRTPEIRLRMPYQANNAGWVQFDMTATPPTVSLNLMSEDGEPVWEPIVLTPEDLKNGVATAKANIKLD